MIERLLGVVAAVFTWWDVVVACLYWFVGAKLLQGSSDSSEGMFDLSARDFQQRSGNREKEKKTNRRSAKRLLIQDSELLAGRGEQILSVVVGTVNA